MQQSLNKFEFNVTVVGSVFLGVKWELNTYCILGILRKGEPAPFKINNLSQKKRKE